MVIDSGASIQPQPKLGWFHRYPARFASPALATMFRGIERRLQREPTYILDPFAGVGSTLAAARARGIASVGVELTTLGAIVGRTRLAPPKELDAALDLVNAWACRLPPESRDSDGELEFWLGSRNTRMAVALRDRIMGVSNEDLRRFLTVALSSSLRPASRWLAGSIKAQLDPRRTPSRIEDHWRRTARSLARDCMTEATSAGYAPAHVLLSDLSVAIIAPLK